MTIHAIVKQIAEQLKGHVPISKEEGYSSLYPFDSSIDYYINPTIAFTDPRDDKEHMLDYKDDEDRLAQLKKINTVITTYNKVADKNQKEFLSKVPSDGKVHTPEEFGFTKPTIPIGEHPLWAFTVMGRTKRGDGYDDIKLIAIDNRKLYKLRINLNNDSEFIANLNRLIFNHIQIKRKESEKMGTWDSNNIWYKPNQRFHKWFQINNVSVKDGVQEGGRPKGTTKRTINRYIKVFQQFEIIKKNFTSKTNIELYELLSTRTYDSKKYSKETIKNIIEQKKYNLTPTR